MAMRWRGLTVSLFVVACGARSSLLLEDGPITADGDSGSGASKPAGGGGAPGSGASASVGAASGVGGAAGGGGRPGSGGALAAGGSGLGGGPFSTGGRIDFEDYEPTVTAITYPERAASPALALAISPSGEAAVVFFTTEKGHVGQARWLGASWEPGLDGTDDRVRTVTNAWLSEDGYRSWVSYEFARGSSPYPLGSEIFSGGLPFGVTTSIEEFQLPYRQVSFEKPPLEVVLDRSGDTGAAFLDTSRFQYMVRDWSVPGSDSSYVLPHVMAALEDCPSALISLRDQVLWEDARYDGTGITLSHIPVDGAFMSRLPRHTFVPFGLSYSASSSVWGAWRVVPPASDSSEAFIRFGLLRTGGDHLIWEFPTIRSPRFIEGGGLTVSRDGEVAATTWGYRLANASAVRLAWIKNWVSNEGITVPLETPSLCRVSAPALSASGHRLIASAHCSDGRAYLLAPNWQLSLSDWAADLPKIALSDSGNQGFVAWTEWVPGDSRYRIETRVLVW